MAGMKVSPGFEDPSARPETRLAARLLLALTLFVMVTAVVAIGIWVWPAVTDVAARLWTSLSTLV